MSKHMPECTSEYPWESPFDRDCICAKLRACEARVREGEQKATDAYRGSCTPCWNDAHDACEKRGCRCRSCIYAAALRDAVAAVKALPAAWSHPEHDDMDDVDRKSAVAAIEGLGGER